MTTRKLLRIKRKGYYEIIRGIDKNFPFNAELTIEIVCGLIKISADGQKLVEYTDPHPIMEKGNKRIGVFYSENPFKRFEIYLLLLDWNMSFDILDLRLGCYRASRKIGFYTFSGIEKIVTFLFERNQTLIPQISKPFFAEGIFLFDYFGF